MSDRTVRVSSARPPHFIFEAAKEVLKKTGAVELHGLGKAISSAVRVADMLTTEGYAVSASFHTTLETFEDEKKPLPKVIITLTKSPQFDHIYEEHLKATTVVDVLQTTKK